MMNKKVDLVKIFKALSSEKRYHLFKMLYEWYKSSGCTDLESSFDEGIEKCFSKACCCMDLSRSTISYHFKELHNAGLITYTRNGRCFICKINLEAVEAVRKFLK
ncbi:ArsR/SmtB family transcription factor [Iocasia frigidifontis]|nr:ArsR family transcriptional regulator [Iocasia fonsfrigidae]